MAVQVRFRSMWRRMTSTSAEACMWTIIPSESLGIKRCPDVEMIMALTNYLIAPIDNPRTSCFCATQPARTTGSEASVAAAASWAQ
ncbi:hypothetical protein SAMN04488563_4183 [Jiangella alkaliphila]|uniref:Uncharacterized protein n=1 Tax=Jiangella alkaliphila TaxID=419479 RepID=A0A1H2KSR9_9ACTN|nr:hypothetical protein SAMN04488563_4183 [Jiangella alkaliphila]